MSEPFRAMLVMLHRSLVSTFSAPKEDLPRRQGDCSSLARRIAEFRLDETTPTWDERLVEHCLSAAVLLEHLGEREAASVLLAACRRSAEHDPVTLARFTSAELLINTRRGAQGQLLGPWVASGAPGEVAARLTTNVTLSGRYDHALPGGEETTSLLGEEAFAGGSVAHFALTSFAFDNAIFAARLTDARAALGRLEHLAAAIMTDLGESHPYLGLVLLALSSAKCALAAVEGNLQDLRRYADVLAVAVQRASAQLGPEHAQTIGGLANLTHIEFEIALASGSPHEVRWCVENLTWLERHAGSVFGSGHPTTVILAMNAAVAQLESARQQRSVAMIQDAESQLLAVARRSEDRFGSFHPCTAIARSNAASAGFDVARARRSRPHLERMVTVLEDTVSQVSNSLGAGHATARALTRQLRACHRLLASDTPWTEGAGGGTGTIVRTVEDEMWGLDDDYVPVYETSPPTGRGRAADESEAPIVVIDGKVKRLEPGDVVECLVTRVTADGVLVDINGLTEGLIPAGELSLRQSVRPEDVVSVGDTVETMVLRGRGASGLMRLSLRMARHERAWNIIAKLEAAGEPVRGKVVAVVEDGLFLDLDIGLRAFLPASAVELHSVPDLRSYAGRELEAKIVELDRSLGNVVLSRGVWLALRSVRTRGKRLTELRQGDVRRGVVSLVVNFGAFVDLGGVDGLVDVSELSWRHIDHPSEVVEVGQEVRVEVLDVDMDREPVSLSLKALQEDPWPRFTRGTPQFVLCEVTRLAPFGVFVRVGDDVDGLIHIAELAEHRVAIPQEVVRVGEQVAAKIIGLEPEQRRVLLSLKQAMDPGRKPLSQREWEILRLVAEGRSQREVATTVHMPQSAVALAVSQINRKLGLRDEEP
ncbi:MAG TPA: S1 RNA-binding domain-containing protein [Actinophytocola sp.]